MALPTFSVARCAPRVQICQNNTQNPEFPQVGQGAIEMRSPSLKKNSPTNKPNQTIDFFFTAPWVGLKLPILHLPSEWLQRSCRKTMPLGDRSI
jgi:hypothetical protein